MPFFQKGYVFGIYTYIGDSVFLKRKELILPGQFLCKCGRETTITFQSVIVGKPKKCLRCGYVKFNFGDKYGSLTYKGESIDISRADYVELSCECGKIKKILCTTIIRGITTTCGNCNEFTLMNGYQTNNLTYIGPDIKIKPQSHSFGLFRCKCGNEKKILYKDIFGLKRLGCGSCSKFLLNNGSVYNDLKYIGTTEFVRPMSTKSLLFRCKCGNEKKIQLQYVIGGRTKTCGSCFDRMLKWKSENSLKLKEIKSPHDIPTGGPVMCGEYTNASSPFSANCPLCDQIYNPRLRDIKRGVSITCGCSNNRISSLNHDLNEYIHSIGEESILEYGIDDRKYDIYIPRHNLIIELNGLKWHSYDHSKERDFRKYILAKNHNYKYMMIYEDELNDKFDIMSSIIRYRLGRINSQSIRPNQCKIVYIKSNTADEFYLKHHYIGPTKSNINIGCYYADLLVSCISFKKPTRLQMKYSYEITRMASDSFHKVHGIWSKMTQKFLHDYSPKNLVSFSDNRLFDGRVYETIGFKHDGNIRPDYYWTIGRKRFHKSSMRKDKNDKLLDMTESEIRTRQGYRKIWDLGKRRWVMNVC